MTRRIFAQMVIKNEAGRYLDNSLEWHGGIFDGIHVYDDESDDGSVELARDHGCYVTERPFTVSPFLKHEGKFRQAAWRAMVEKVEPTAEDWIFCIDADEFLVSRRDECAQLHFICAEAEHVSAEAVLIHIPEVFAVDEVKDESGILLTNPKVRVDGYWGTIAGTRLFRYRPGGQIADRPMASGSEPTYVANAPRIDGHDFWLMHYGYADPVDRQAKYERYSTREGHANAHVASIAQTPELVPWDGPHIDVRRGVKGDEPANH